MHVGVKPFAPATALTISALPARSGDSLGLSVVKEYGGHGIGRHVFHGEPHVSHSPIATPTEEFKPGMIFTIEPMVNAGRRHRRT